MVSRARLGVRRRYRDDICLYSRYAKTGYEWCHVLISASVVATATTSVSTRVMLRQGGSGVTCSARDPASLPRGGPPASRYPKTGWQWCHVLVSVFGGATAAASAPAPLTPR